jgi:hypothetical protein
MCLPGWESGRIDQQELIGRSKKIATNAEQHKVSSLALSTMSSAF